MAGEQVGPLIRQAVKNLNLVELVVRESVGGFQAIAKYSQTKDGPWGVGVNEDPIFAIEKALFNGANELRRVRETALVNSKTRKMADDLL